eukprot:XP_011669836.1 PREDICTED: disintegrin and metalloproteinase domain-containing protein 1a-like [Strongylocentrotus purpuratus]
MICFCCFPISNSSSFTIPAECHYEGFVEEIPGSFVSIDVCNGLRGLILSGTETLVIEPLHPHEHELLGDHVIANSGMKSEWRGLYTTSRSHHHRRVRRDVTDEMKYITADILVSQSFNDRYSSTTVGSSNKARTIASLANHFLDPLKVDLIIRNVVVFVDEDPIEYTSNLHMMLADLENYVRNTSSYEDMNTPPAELADITEYLT